MALNSASLASQLSSIRGNTSISPNEAAKRYAKALVQFWSQGQTPGFGSVIADPSEPIMSPLLIQTWSVQQPSQSQAAKAVAGAIEKGFRAVQGTGGLFVQHVLTTPAPAASLASQLTAIWSSYPPTAQQACRQEAEAILQWTRAGTMQGTGNPSSGIPPQFGPMT